MQMDEATQQNSALVEENAATAKTLEIQARALDERGAFFQIRAEASQADDSPGAADSQSLAARAHRRAA
jgi:hypothetical protein